MAERKQQSDQSKHELKQGNGGARSGALASARPRSLGSFGSQLAPLNRLRSEFDRLFDDVFHGWPGFWSAEQQPAWELDIRERDDAIVVRADAPGFEPGDFDVEIRGDNLVLCACQSEESKNESGEQWQKREFYRSVPLPAEVDAEKIDANYRNGVLTLTLPKTKQAKGRKIEVKG